MSVAERLPNYETPALEVARAAAIELPPADVLPGSVRAAAERYGASDASRAELVAAVDQVGHRWEHAIAGRAIEARAELVDACRRAAELHDELVRLQAAARWLRSFPWRSSWEVEPYRMHVGGRQAAVPEILGAIEDTCAVEVRLVGLARRGVPREAPYEPPVGPAPRRGRPSRGAAHTVLAAAGPTLGDIAERMPAGASVSAVGRWLAGNRPYPAELVDVLEQLVGAETASRVISLIPSG